MGLDVRYAAHPDDVRGYDTEKLREHFHRRIVLPWPGKTHLFTRRPNHRRRYHACRRSAYPGGRCRNGRGLFLRASRGRHYQRRGKGHITLDGERFELENATACISVWA